ncbi:MAG TPA: hypothetical protein PK831_01910 [Candidatus Magasanikbacteria bacterium]|jgi:polyhydroxyalkanoate synthesis regulator phasin|nr:hypothetical protein [Candidatus Magasanikbacteria bacterium]HQL52633.1 hypothetical protein [Candidatus Magasanikbacteria bacterium]
MSRIHRISEYYGDPSPEELNNTSNESKSEVPPLRYIKGDLNKETSLDQEAAPVIDKVQIRRDIENWLVEPKYQTDIKGKIELLEKYLEDHPDDSSIAKLITRAKEVQKKSIKKFIDDMDQKAKAKAEAYISRQNEESEKEQFKLKIDSIINALVSFGESKQSQPTDDTLIDIVSLPKEQAKQIFEEILNRFNEQQNDLPQEESRFKKVISSIRGKNDAQIREENFLNGFVKLQTTVFKAKPEAIHAAVSRGISSKDKVGNIEDNLSGNIMGSDIEEKMKK